ncbi:uncharacterized protein [Nicotiana tomentosiformis]|uniref:uncharacterized protein isoform X1 n=1 Tax=Nicotiana tomentosiformis TaxID=4098 RepID=UPI00388CA813
MSSTFSGDETTPFFGFLGATAALVFSRLSAGMAIGIVGDAGVRDKKWGGLGLRDLKMHNKSLLFKWLWKYSSEDEAFWKQIIEAVHGVKGGMETMFSYSHTKRVGLEEHNQVMG